MECESKKAGGRRGRSRCVEGDCRVRSRKRKNSSTAAAREGERE